MDAYLKNLSLDRVRYVSLRWFLFSFLASRTLFRFLAPHSLRLTGTTSQYQAIEAFFSEFANMCRETITTKYICANAGCNRKTFDSTTTTQNVDWIGTRRCWLARDAQKGRTPCRSSSSTKTVKSSTMCAKCTENAELQIVARVMAKRGMKA